ncbi:MAG: NIPSNAP family containing protein [Chloroflexi bacterium]|nr:MAG: NIPSNAP family containing protein [Chloroflexota bacterium]
MTTSQLREYTVKPGEMAAWIDEWRSRIVPLRLKHGFKVVGAWTVDGTDQFVWIVSYDGPKSFQEADAAYYQSPDRKAIDPDPARHLAHTQTRLMTSA